MPTRPAQKKMVYMGTQIESVPGAEGHVSVVLRPKVDIELSRLGIFVGAGALPVFLTKVQAGTINAIVNSNPVPTSTFSPFSVDTRLRGLKISRKYGLQLDFDQPVPSQAVIQIAVYGLSEEIVPEIECGERLVMGAAPIAADSSAGLVARGNTRPSLPMLVQRVVWELDRAPNQSLLSLSGLNIGTVDYDVGGNPFPVQGGGWSETARGVAAPFWASFAVNTTLAIGVVQPGVGITFDISGTESGGGSPVTWRAALFGRACKMPRAGR